MTLEEFTHSSCRLLLVLILRIRLMSSLFLSPKICLIKYVKVTKILEVVFQDGPDHQMV